MKIGISTNTLEPSFNRGHLDGIGVYTKHLLEGLINHGLWVEPFSFPSIKQQHRLEVGQSLRLPFPVAALAPPRFVRLSPLVDIYHATDYKIVPMRCPVVATLYDAIPMVDPRMANPRLRSIKNRLLRRMARNADIVVAISSFSVAELIEHYRVDESRIRVIHCGVDASWLQSLDADFVSDTLQYYDLEPGYFLTVGTLQPRKNLERILAAHDNLPKTMRLERPLVVVGKAGWRCEAIIESLNRKSQLGEARWLSDVSDPSRLRALYAGADGFVFPSLYEGFGLPVLEAFASGVPVVTSNTTSLCEVSAGVAWEINPKAVDEIASAMISSVQPGIERERRIVAGRKRATEMTWAKMVDRIIDVYRELV